MNVFVLMAIASVLGGLTVPLAMIVMPSLGLIPAFWIELRGQAYWLGPIWQSRPPVTPTRWTCATTVTSSTFKPE